MTTSTAEFADASPEKRLFISLLTRDITLADAILDLIDNSINSAIVTQRIPLNEPDDYIALFESDSNRPALPIAISLDAKTFRHQ